MGGYYKELYTLSTELSTIVWIDPIKLGIKGQKLGWTVKKGGTDMKNKVT